MTEQEMALHDDQMRDEIVRLGAETAKLQSEAGKMQAETRKISKESDWYLLIVGSTATLAIVAIVKLFL